MIFDLSTELDRQKAVKRFDSLLSRRAVVELSEKVKRSVSQNSYLHLLITAVAMDVGVSVDYAKEIYYKRIANKELFLRIKDDSLVGKVETLRSSADLSKEELSLSIDRFKMWAASNGMYLPEPGDQELLRAIEIQAARLNSFL